MSVSKQIIEKINTLIVNALNEGQKPWRKTWSDITIDDNLVYSPINMMTKKAYRGFNRFILGLHPSPVPVFLTFNQIQSLKGSVNKGAKSLPILYFEKVDIQEKATDVTTQEGTQQKTRFIIKYYNVFNILDTNIDVSKYFKLAEERDNQPIKSVEPIVKKYLKKEKIALVRSYDGNYYKPFTDTIHMINIKKFETSNDYYSTLLHEAVHSTGHSKRLDRFENHKSRKDYAFEELIAETAAAYLSTQLEISNDDLLDNSAAYIQSWLKALDNDPYFFYQAAKEAEIASNYILGQ